MTTLTHECGGQMKPSTVAVRVPGDGLVTWTSVPGYVCDRCGETDLAPEAVDALTRHGAASTAQASPRESSAVGKPTVSESRPINKFSRTLGNAA